MITLDRISTAWKAPSPSQSPMDPPIAESRILKYYLWGCQAEVITEPNRLEARADPVHLLPQVIVVAILVAPEVIIWIIPTIVARILFRKLIAQDFDNVPFLPRICQINLLSRLGKGNSARVLLQAELLPNRMT